MGTLRWVGLAVVPALIVAVLVFRSDRRREPWWLVLITFLLGGALGLAMLVAETYAARWVGLGGRQTVAENAGSIPFLFLVVAPMRELAKLMAIWPAYRSKYFDEPYDGIVYSAASALGYAAVENALVLRGHPSGALFDLWVARALMALPAHLFCAAWWGYGLGRAKEDKVPGRAFAPGFFAATLGHALYIHFNYARGPNGLVILGLLLLPMAIVAFMVARDLRARGERASLQPDSVHETRLSRVSISRMTQPPSLRAVRAALRRGEQPIMLRWIALGVFVTIGAMLMGLAIAVLVGNWLQIDFSVVDQHELSPAPVVLLGAGLLTGFFASGFLVARASGVTTLLEPALATALALLLTVIALGLAAPGTLLLGVVISPAAWIIACGGAWVGRAVR